VALALGGGGHKQAAGATIEGTLVEVRDRVLPLLRQIARRRPAKR
jgi:phosphoesterase RecJ-like protein